MGRKIAAKRHHAYLRAILSEAPCRKWPGGGLGVLRSELSVKGGLADCASEAARAHDEGKGECALDQEITTRGAGLGVLAGWLFHKVALLEAPIKPGARSPGCGVFQRSRSGWNRA